ncbi:hypothetical protein EJM73_08830 [Clostridium botulinum]|uniref:hypothetical protein n=1 Tax=Clostridium botulinum TaxID=1491 RepID=UPI001376033A|nr:hypothetical protein [Clostridium botulinum]NCI19728.1 hypothetical protein [Clostridium botulinum]NCI35766.1 hypothetical protein [Clostridium botulinum]NCI71623.1 hypothetical protein [Clostridium botulinum]NDI38815.1 hypothetical protein [Clostridium botulinum]HCL4447186.1 hypothetical protein [Clostridium botulinum]
MRFFKRIFCKHKYKYLSKEECKHQNPYLFDCGRTKRADVVCIKCGKKNNVDIFNLSKRKWYEEGD